MTSSTTAVKSRPVLSVEERKQLEIVLTRRFFYDKAFEIYGGTSGLYDYGPSNIIDIWRRHFVLEEDMLEVDTTILTREDVLQTSDWMCKDESSGEFYRADTHIEEVLENRIEGDKLARGISTTLTKEEEDKKAKRKKKIKDAEAIKLDDAVVAKYQEILNTIDDQTGEGLAKIIKEHNITSPTGAPLREPEQFNLMFSTLIGPTGTSKAYMRPETAQGQFLNFKKLYEFNNRLMPFASASVGKSFRNEISPRSGLLRVREFLMAEIEHFVDPDDKRHPRFAEIKDIKVSFLPRSIQESGKSELQELSIGEAVSGGIVNNETLGYFLARIYLFMRHIGMDPAKIRFRQHMQNEMAHYAKDCWDCELRSSYGWIECVGCADRAAYDLSVHSEKTKTKLVVAETLKEPKITVKREVILNQKLLGPKLRKDKSIVEAAILAWTEDEKNAAKEELEKSGSVKVTADGRDFDVDKSLISIGDLKEHKEHIREYIPSVIEPSFGIGRILYSLLEHSYWARSVEDDQVRGVLSFPASTAPVKCLLVPLSANAEFTPHVKEISNELRKLGISSKVDASSVSIGRRYARNDELGTPFGITVDFVTTKDKSITLRERDSMEQVRGTQNDILSTLSQLINGDAVWSDVVKKFGLFSGQDLDKE